MKKVETCQARAQEKCSPCLWGKDCFLLSSQRDECLGPFMAVQDQITKFQMSCKEDLSKPKADLDRAAREVLLKDYLRKKGLFDSSGDQ